MAAYYAEIWITEVKGFIVQTHEQNISLLHWDMICQGKKFYSTGQLITLDCELLK